jgi:hypothetical protein
MDAEFAKFPEAEPTDAPSGRVFVFAFGGASVALLLGAGCLLWWRHGDAVFSEIALAGLAWCF